MMEELKKKSQIMMLVLMATLVFVSPLISASLRPKYLYFIFNLLIVALAAEAGLLLPHSRSSAVSPASKSTVPFPDTTATTPAHEGEGASDHELLEKPSSAEKTNNIGTTSLQCCPSMPSLFFIAGEDQDEHQDSVEDDHQEYLISNEASDQEDGPFGEVISGQELFTKAETFIGNFYKQLQMQREDSGNRMAAL